MTRFINTALIGLVAFIVILAVLWLAVDPRAPGLATSGASHGDVRVRGVEADWAGSDAIDLELMLRNAGSAATLTQAAYRATLDGQVIATQTEDPPGAVPAEGDAPLRLRVRLPDDLPARMLAASAADGTAVLRIDGTLSLRSATDDQRLPFEWQGSLRPELASRIEAARQDCPGPPAPLCLAGLTADAGDGDRVQVKMSLRNDEAQALWVREGGVRLVFEDRVVATGSLAQPLRLDAGDAATATVTLAFDDGELADWWASHVQRCETSRLALAISLSTAPVDNESAAANDVAWELRAAPLGTGLLCKGSSS